MKKLINPNSILSLDIIYRFSTPVVGIKLLYKVREPYKTLFGKTKLRDKTAYYINDGFCRETGCDRQYIEKCYNMNKCEFGNDELLYQKPHVNVKYMNNHFESHYFDNDNEVDEFVNHIKQYNELIEIN